MATYEWAWNCRRRKFPAKEARNDDPTGTPSPAYCTVTVTEFEVIVVVPLTYCANTVVGPVAVEDCTHIGSIPF